MDERVPPCSEEAEMGVLGSCLLEGARVVPLCLNLKLTGEAFYVPAHRLIFEAMLALWEGERHRGVDVLTVGQKLRDHDKLDRVGGGVFLDRLVDATPTAAHAQWYLDTVYQKWLLRKGIQEARAFEAECYEAESGEKLLTQAPERFAELMPNVEAEESNTAVMARSIERWEKARRKEAPASGLPLPWAALNELMCGLEAGLTILAGNQSQGKTTVEDIIATNLAAQGIPVGRLTLDATKEKLLNRALCRKAGVSLPKLKFGYAGESNMARIREAKEALQQYPMYIESKHRDIREICSLARVWSMKYGIGLLTVDYVQIVRAEQMGRSEYDQFRKVTYVSNRLKDLSGELDMPVLALSQLSRANEKDDRPPQMSDLRDSGALEQDADKIAVIRKHNKTAKEWDEANPGTTKKRRPVWIDVLKHKDGETGKVPFLMMPHYFRLDELDPELPEPFAGRGVAAAGERQEEMDVEFTEFR